MKTLPVFLLVLLTIGTTVNAQNRAPSCWLNYNDNFKGDLIVNTVRVANPSPLYTYYCTMQWNAGQEGGGYCGIQEHPDGRNFIFSIWDPKASNEAIKAAYVGDGTEIANFGGEGTGLRSLNFSVGWETNRWYSFVSRAWDYHSHTHFGYWVFDIYLNKWHHLITMDFPVEGVRFNTGTGSFIEEWVGNGQLKRGVNQKNGWKRAYRTKMWRAFESARFSRVSPDAGAANYIEKYNGGVAINQYYFMESGGSSSPVSNASGATLRVNNPNNKPDFRPIRIDEFTYDVIDQELSLDWQAADSTSPQFSFELDLINTSQNDELVYSEEINIPHQRDFRIDLSTYPDGNYKLIFHLSDIFDQESEFKEGEFALNTTGTDDIFETEKSLWYLSNNHLQFNAQELEHLNYQIYNLNGSRIRQGRSSDQIQLSSLPATFLLIIQNEKNGEVLASQVFVNPLN